MSSTASRSFGAPYGGSAKRSASAHGDPFAETSIQILSPAWTAWFRGFFCQYFELQGTGPDPVIRTAETYSCITGICDAIYDGQEPTISRTR